MNEFNFESYGVKVRIECPDDDLFEKAVAVARRTLLDRLTTVDRSEVEHVFSLRNVGGRYFMYLNGEDLGDGEIEWVCLKYLDTRVRLVIAEHAVGVVFMHAGVVAWKGKGIVIPGDSFSGKTTLVAELVKKGAVYYSDEYAIIDRAGNVHPFPRLLSMRDKSGNYLKTDITVESLGGVIGLDPIPVFLVLLTRFRSHSRWKPIILTSGVGVMKMMLQAISLRFQSEFTLEVLKTVANRAIIIEGVRNNANNSADKIIRLVDSLKN